MAEEGGLEEALRILLPMMDEDFDNPRMLFLAGYIFIKSGKTSLAYQMFRRASELSPHIPHIWLNLGKCWHEKRLYDQAEACFRKAVKLKPDYALALNNIGLTYLGRGDNNTAIAFCDRALAIDPQQEDALINRGMAFLAKRKWKEGWEGYNLNVGKLADRKERQYGEETRWNGEKNKRIICYGEQGIGDEISFASCIPDLIGDSQKVIIESDKRTANLFKRSFPEATVYGTRYKDEIDWPKDEKFDHRVAVGALPQFYRNDDKDFPGAPFLVPDPQMQVQWRALLNSLGPRPKIGIAWVGGRPHTHRDRRSVTLQTLLPLLKYDANWISLQYKDTEEIADFEDMHGVKIHHWPWGVECYDYDQTVALISELDLVISVTTTVVHAAGGLGKECWCLVPEKVMWRYMEQGSDFPWAKSVTLYRQRGKEWPVNILLGKLKEKFG